MFFLQRRPSGHVQQGTGESLPLWEDEAEGAAGAAWIEDPEAVRPFKKVVREVEQYICQMQTLFVLESLENLRKNGRLTKLQAVVTGALRIKLLMGATPQGEICKLGQALTMKQALGKLVDRMAADPDHQGRVAAVCHCNCLERAFALKEQIEAKCQFQQVLILEAGGITTVYANDGGVVVAY